MTTYLCQSYSFESFYRIRSSNKKLRCLPGVVLKRWNQLSEDASSAHSLYTSGPDATLASGMRVMWPHTGRCVWWDQIQNKNNKAIEEFDISVFLFLGVNSFCPQGGGLTDRDPPEQRFPRQRPLWTETPLDRDPSGQRPLWTETPLDRDPSGQRPLWTETPLDREPPDRDLSRTPPGQIPPGQRPPCTVKSIRYPSYWNGFLFINCFWRTSVFVCGATNTPILYFWWCLLWVSKPYSSMAGKTYTKWQITPSGGPAHARMPEGECTGMSANYCSQCEWCKGSFNTPSLYVLYDLVLCHCVNAHNPILVQEECD